METKTFEQQVINSRDMLYARALTLLRDGNLAMDLVQDTDRQEEHARLQQIPAAEIKVNVRLLQFDLPVLSVPRHAVLQLELTDKTHSLIEIVVDEEHPTMEIVLGLVAEVQVVLAVTADGRARPPARA